MSENVLVIVSDPWELAGRTIEARIVESRKHRDRTFLRMTVSNPLVADGREFITLWAIGRHANTSDEWEMSGKGAFGIVATGRSSVPVTWDTHERTPGALSLIGTIERFS